jgi:hypothetical protein
MKINNHIKSPKQFSVEELITFAITELNIKNDIEITLAYNTRLLEKLSKDVEFVALLQNPVPNNYVLFVKEGSVNQYVLCHELIHLHQYDRGDLKTNQDFTEVIWKGKLFDNSTPYEERE